MAGHPQIHCRLCFLQPHSSYAYGYHVQLWDIQLTPWTDSCSSRHACRSRHPLVASCSHYPIHRCIPFITESHNYRLCRQERVSRKLAARQCDEPPLMIHRSRLLRVRVWQYGLPVSKIPTRGDYILPQIYLQTSPVWICILVSTRIPITSSNPPAENTCLGHLAVGTATTLGVFSLDLTRDLPSWQQLWSAKYTLSSHCPRVFHVLIRFDSQSSASDPCCLFACDDLPRLRIYSACV